MNYVPSQLQARFKELGFIWSEFHLIGIRSKNYVPNTFCDSFYLIAGKASFKMQGTTRPGKHWLQNIMNKAGAAVMKADQQCFGAYALGKHRGVYKAWVQVKPVIVHRDNDKDELAEEQGVLQKGLFGINVHRSSDQWVSKLVDKWSAGCSVLNVPSQYKTFIQLTEQSGLKSLTYTLLREF